MITTIDFEDVFITEATEDKSKIIKVKYGFIIKQRVNTICKDLYNAKKDYVSTFPSCPKFKEFLIDGKDILIIIDIPISSFSTGLGLDFQSDVCKALNKDDKLKDLYFQCEDYPGIYVELN